jgi:hypothetical protein
MSLLLCGRALDFETEGPRFESRQWQFSLLQIYRLINPVMQNEHQIFNENI